MIVFLLFILRVESKIVAWRFGQFFYLENTQKKNLFIAAFCWKRNIARKDTIWKCLCRKKSEINKMYFRFSNVPFKEAGFRHVHRTRTIFSQENGKHEFKKHQFFLSKNREYPRFQKLGVQKDAVGFIST